MKLEIYWTLHLLYYLQSDQDEANNKFFNYPNPFSSTHDKGTIFVYNVMEDFNDGSLIIFDPSGQIVYTKDLSNDVSKGTHEIPWDGKTNQGKLLSTGVYFSVIKFGKESMTRVNKIAIINNE